MAGEWRKKTVALGHHHPWPISKSDLSAEQKKSDATWQPRTIPLRCKDQKAIENLASHLPLRRLHDLARSSKRNAKKKEKKLFINEIVTLHKWNYMVYLDGGGWSLLLGDVFQLLLFLKQQQLHAQMTMLGCWCKKKTNLNASWHQTRIINQKSTKKNQFFWVSSNLLELEFSVATRSLTLPTARAKRYEKSKVFVT